MAPGSGARGSRATDFGSLQPVIRWEPTDCGTRIGGPRISGYEFGFCTSTPSLGLPGVGPTPSGPRDLGQRIWDLSDHSPVLRNVIEDPLSRAYGGNDPAHRKTNDSIKNQSYTYLPNHPPIHFPLFLSIFPHQTGP